MPHRSSQIAWIVTTVYAMYTQTALHIHENSCTVLIPLCKNNLNLPMCPSFFLPYAWLPPPVHDVAMLATLSALIFLFVCFTKANFVDQP